MKWTQPIPYAVALKLDKTLPSYVAGVGGDIPYTIFRSPMLL